MCVCLAREQAPCEALESTLKRQLDVATVVVSQRTTASKASDPKEAVERILRAISSPSLSRLTYDGPKINDSKDPFARYPDLQEEKAIIHDKKVESYVLMAPGSVLCHTPYDLVLRGRRASTSWNRRDTVSSTQAPGKVDVEKAEDVLHSLSRK